MSDYPPVYIALMKGEDEDGNEIVLAVDTSRAFITKLQGNYSGVLKDIAVDEEGRIISREYIHKFFLTYADQTATTTTTEINFPFPWAKIELINTGATNILFNINASVDAISTVLTAGSSKIIDIQATSISFKTEAGSSTLRIRGSGWYWWNNSMTETIVITDTIALKYGFEYTDSFSFTESILWNATFYDTETIPVAESILLNIGIPISDSFTIGESIAVTFEIASSDSFSFTDTIVVVGNIIISDSFSVTELINLRVPIVEEFIIDEAVIISLDYISTDEIEILDTLTLISDILETESITLIDAIITVATIIESESITIVDDIDGYKGASGTHTYVCNDSDAQGYYGYTSADGGFAGTSGEFTSGDYNYIDGDDSSNVMDQIGAAGQYIYHKFDFTIDEAVGDITQVAITYKGYCTREAIYRTELWVKEGGYWIERASHTNSSKTTLTKSYTSSISNIVQSAHVWVGVQNGYSSTGPLAPSVIYSYYIKVVITYDSQEDLFP